MVHRLCILFLVVVGAVASTDQAGAYNSPSLTPVDTTDLAALEASASRAFYQYLLAIDEERIDSAYEQAYDPDTVELRVTLVDRLLAFMRARVKSPVRNEAMIVRTAGDWAMVVYQYDTTVAGKTARVITTAWMVQWEGYWRQFVVAPQDPAFWESRRSDYERLQQWFDEHAEELTPQA